jgi:hypothetical protein
MLLKNNRGEYLHLMLIVMTGGNDEYHRDDANNSAEGMMPIDL